MPQFTAAARFSHDQPALSAVLLVQLGTPDAPEPAPVRRYLAQFLSDPRVVEIPRPLWMLILHGIILRFRPGASARKYAAVWTQAGSPLAVHTQAQSAALGATLLEHAPGVQVVFAMRYGNPSIPEVLLRLREQGLQRLLVLPLYPQYSASTTATVWDTVFDALQRWRNLPELRLIRSFTGIQPTLPRWRPASVSTGPSTAALKGWCSVFTEYPSGACCSATLTTASAMQARVCLERRSDSSPGSTW